MNHKKAHILFFAGIALTMIVCFVGSLIQFQYTYLIAAAVLIASMYGAEKYYLCPHCEGKLSFKKIRPNTCPHCGEKIEW